MVDTPERLAGFRRKYNFLDDVEKHVFKKKRQLINPTNLNKLLRSPIYPHSDDQLRAAYLILDYSTVYRSFQAAGKAITMKHHFLPYMTFAARDTFYPRPSKSAEKKGGIKATLLLLSLLRTSGPSLPRDEFDVQEVIPSEESPVKMMLQRSGVTFAQLSVTPTMPRTQTPPVPIANAPVVTQATPTTAIVATSARETRTGRKRLRGVGHTSTTPSSENSLLDLRDSRVNVVGDPAYMHSFTVDGVPLPATDRVRPWREGRKGKVAKSMGEALPLPKDMKHWAKWDDDSLILNMKKKAIMGYQCSVVIEERYQANKARAEELSNDNEDLLKKISDVMNKSQNSRALDKLEVEAGSSLRQEPNVPIPTKLVIIPKLEIQVIINDKSPVRKVEGARPTMVLRGETTTSAALSSTEEPHV
nr:hypothetical protein CFP56_74742 [Quercus suber]